MSIEKWIEDYNRQWDKVYGKPAVFGLEPDTRPGCEDSVIEKIKKRRELGLKKYGVSVDDNPLTRKQWLQHAQDEAMDLAIYLERLMKEEV